MHFSVGVSRHKEWGRPVFQWALAFVVLLTASGRLAPRVFADDGTALRETARKLAERVAAIPGLRAPLRLDWHPADTWSEGEGARWLDVIRDEFDRRGLQLTDDATAPVLAVYAAETPVQVVLTAKTRVGDRDEVRIVNIPRSTLPPAELPVAPVRLEHELVYESPDHILDASYLASGSDAGLAVLLYKNFEVTLLRLDVKGQLQQTLPLNVAGLRPTRDPHADLLVHGNQASAQLWGKVCDFAWDPPGDVKCRAEKNNPLASAAWPADAVLTSPCDGTNWTIADPGSDPAVRAELRLVPDGATAGSSATLTSEFPGPVLNFNAEQSSGGALIVVRNLRTGNYEVYKISLACGD